MLHTKEERRVQVISHAVCLIFTIMALLPFVLMVIGSFTDDTWASNNDGFTYFPGKWSLEAYQYVSKQWSMIGRAYLMTIIVAASLELRSKHHLRCYRGNLWGLVFLSTASWYSGKRTINTLRKDRKTGIRRKSINTKPNPFDELTALFRALPLDRKEALLEKFQVIVDEEKEHEEESTLAQAWEEIQYNLDYLRHEPYIDDQVEIDEIWNICVSLAEGA